MIDDTPEFQHEYAIAALEHADAIVRSRTEDEHGFEVNPRARFTPNEWIQIAQVHALLALYHRLGESPPRPEPAQPIRARSLNE